MNKKVLIDKQALIDELMKIPGVGSNSDALETIKRFPSYEPQKHVMPKFFDKWAKQVLEKRDKFYAISLITRAGWGYGVDFELNYDRSPSGTKELLNWIVENEGDDYPNKKKAVEALLHGYEVEKEPLYTVTFNLDLNYHLVLDEGDGDDEISTTLTTGHDVLGYRYFLTEQEIKAIDERYWPFAVPVEEGD